MALGACWRYGFCFRPHGSQMDTIATPPILSAEEVSAYLAKEFPQIGIGRNFSVEAVGPMSARLRLHYRADHLRPGGTISGPTIFALADVGLYVAILAQIGPVKLAEARLLKLGKRLAVGEVTMFSVGEPEIVAHATGTYSIPPRDGGDVVL